MTRFMSKSTVLPNPWQRGQAPNGLLKLNRRGSGSRPGRVTALAFIGGGKPVLRALRIFLAGNFLEDHLTRFAKCDLGRIHDARAIVRTDHNAIDQHEYRQREVEIEQRSGVENSKIFPCW